MRHLVLLLGPLLFAAEGPFDKLGSDDLARGRRLFEAQCGLCHGINGGGGKAANLAVPRFRHAADDASLLDLIRSGIPNTEMPAAWWMSGRESLQVAYYVRSLGRQSSTVQVIGNAAVGKDLFIGKGGCAGCHIIRGEGGSLGPELTEVGARRNPAFLRDTIATPERTLPPTFLMLAVTLRTGKEVRGIRVNEDTFSVQLKDLSGRIHSFRKSDLAKVARESGRTPMPPYKGKFSESELDNLVAYLAGLRGEN